MGKRVSQKERAYEISRKLGAKIIEGAAFNSVEAEAPNGHCWRCEGGTGLHVLVACRWGYEPWPNVWRDLADRMDFGIQQCDCEDCLRGE